MKLVELKQFLTETMHKLAGFCYSIKAGGGEGLDIFVSSIFSMCDIDRMAMLSTFVNVEF